MKGGPEAKRPKLTLISQPTETATPLQLECVTQRKLDEILANETALANSIPTELRRLTKNHHQASSWTSYSERLKQLPSAISMVSCGQSRNPGTVNSGVQAGLLKPRQPWLMPRSSMHRTTSKTEPTAVTGLNGQPFGQIAQCRGNLRLMACVTESTSTSPGVSTESKNVPIRYSRRGGVPICLVC